VEETMKVATALCVSVMLVLGGAACSSKSKDAKAKAEPEAVAAESAAAEVRPAAEAAPAETAKPAEPAKPPAEPATPEPATGPEPPAPPPPPPPASVRPPVVTDGIPELPSYPGAERVKREVETGGYDWSREIEIELVAKETFEKVRAFYLGAIREHGWEVVGTSEKENEVGWKLAKGSSVAEVKIEQEARKRVTIKLERKDR
jgi:hypothetical protein